jgi:Zn-dependent protease with chaperone function
VSTFGGRFYDGRSSRAVPVEVTFFAAGEVRISGEGVSQALRLAEISPSPRLGSAPRILRLPGGASVELAESDALDACLAPLATPASRIVVALERHWRSAVLALIVTAGALFLTLRFAVPALADAVARRLPLSVDRELGRGALEALDGGFFEPTALDEAKRAELEARFASLREAAGIGHARLLFRDGQAIGANAFALPSGIVVVTDQLVERAGSELEVAAVLAHELGHVVHRHGLRSALQDAGTGLLVTAALGDFVSLSSLAAGFPLLLFELEYSRAFEREADAFAIDLLRRADLPPEALADMLERLEEGDEAGPWAAYLSTHPSSEERVAGIRERARQP